MGIKSGRQSQWPSEDPTSKKEKEKKKTLPDLGQISETSSCVTVISPAVFLFLSLPSHLTAAAEEAAILVQSQVWWSEPKCGIRIHLAGSTLGKIWTHHH